MHTIKQLTNALLHELVNVALDPRPRTARGLYTTTLFNGNQDLVRVLDDQLIPGEGADRASLHRNP